LEDLRAQVVVLSNELSLAKNCHLEEQQQWSEEKQQWGEEGALLHNAKSELEDRLRVSETNCNNLQMELDDSRRKLEGLKSFIVEKLA